MIVALRQCKKQKHLHVSSPIICLSNNALSVKNILFSTKSYRKQFVQLKDCYRVRRSTDVANMIISGCVDRERLFVEGGDYLFKNKEIAVNIVAILDSANVMI